MCPRKTDDNQAKLFKDRLGIAKVEAMAGKIAEVYPSFDAPGFVSAARRDGFEKLELKARIAALATRLKEFLPAEYRKAVDILVDTAPHVGGFENWILTSYVEQFGLDHFEDSVYALRTLTPFSSCEFAIRPYMNRYADKMLPILHEWATDPNEHVRRLAAEGSRPRGVWTAHIEAFRKDPQPVIALLEQLKADPSLYVRKAVANNLNDISKDHPDVVINTVIAWKRDGHGHTDWIVKRACRSLVKTGHPAIFEILGFTSSPKVTVAGFSVSPKSFKIGKDCTITCTLKSNAAKSQKLVVDYRVYYIKANGRPTPKLFKWVEKTLKARESIALSTRHSFMDRSTRTHRTGAHEIELIINGRPNGRVSVKLTK
ncbi:MAG TPA: DNA alkylation repair protein [Candidatus Acidoferrum sp.]|nr:DNA alkylation repair protein [Candidatus Acidoferrum sp.]